MYTYILKLAIRTLEASHTVRSCCQSEVLGTSAYKLRDLYPPSCLPGVFVYTYMYLLGSPSPALTSANRHLGTGNDATWVGGSNRYVGRGNADHVTRVGGKKCCVGGDADHATIVGW